MCLQMCLPEGSELPFSMCFRTSTKKRCHSRRPHWSSRQRGWCCWRSCPPVDCLPRPWGRILRLWPSCPATTRWLRIRWRLFGWTEKSWHLLSRRKSRWQQESRWNCFSIVPYTLVLVVCFYGKHRRSLGVLSDPRSPSLLPQTASKESGGGGQSRELQVFSDSFWRPNWSGHWCKVVPLSFNLQRSNNLFHR